MRFIVTVRTLNEERNIERFCRSYRWADKILVADGGSTDRTVLLAQRFKNVEVRPFYSKVLVDETAWRNPHGEHINFLIDWAKDEDADWIAFDDCDCVPTRHLQQMARHYMDYEFTSILAYRMYIYGEDKWFPDMNKPGQSLWAWRSDQPIRAREDDPLKHIIDGIGETEPLKLNHPYSLLHYFAPDEEEIKRKMDFYRIVRENPNITHPTKYGGRIEPLPDWAVSEEQRLENRTWD